MLDGTGANTGEVAVLLISGEGKILSARDPTLFLTGEDPHALIGTSCWEIMNLRHSDGTRACGPDCRFRKQLGSDGTENKTRLVRERDPGQNQHVDVVRFALPATADSTPLFVCLVTSVPLDLDVRDAVDLSPDTDIFPEWPSDLTDSAAQALTEINAGTLTSREQRVLHLLSAGHDTKAIADALYISPVTVKHHVQHILMKLGVHRRIDAILAWIWASLKPTAAQRPSNWPATARPRQPDKKIDSPD